MIFQEEVKVDETGNKEGDGELKALEFEQYKDAKGYPFN